MDAKELKELLKYKQEAFSALVDVMDKYHLTFYASYMKKEESGADADELTLSILGYYGEDEDVGMDLLIVHSDDDQAAIGVKTIEHHELYSYDGNVHLTQDDEEDDEDAEEDNDDDR